MNLFFLDCNRNFWTQNFFFEKFYLWVILMTSSIVNWKESSQNGKKWKSPEFKVVFTFWMSRNLFDNITDSVTFSIFSETYQTVRKSTIWLNQQKMEISTFSYEKFSFFGSAYCLLNYAFCYFFLFLFSSHVTGISSQEKSFFRLWNYDFEFLIIIWLVKYHIKTHTL